MPPFNTPSKNSNTIIQSFIKKKTKSKTRIILAFFHDHRFRGVAGVDTHSRFKKKKTKISNLEHGDVS